MEKNPEVTETGFPARFQQFLSVFNLSEGKLAAQLSTTADEAKNNRVRFGRWSKGQASPSYEGIVALATRYGINVNWLFLGEGEMLRSESVTVKPAVAAIDTQATQEFKRDVDKWEKRYFDLLERHNKLLDSVIEDKYLPREMDFLTASSQTTDSPAGVQMEIGFKQARRNNISDMIEHSIRYYNISQAKPFTIFRRS